MEYQAQPGQPDQAGLPAVSERIQSHEMYTVRLTEGFQTWLDELKDRRAQIRIVARLRQAEAGNLGDWKAVGGEVSEMRVDVGAGYRLYFARRAQLVIVMLAGGDKSTQSKDIRRAKRILEQLELEP
jgi:putative addiction module killer protein